jgi:hypothetical protein
MKIRVSFLLGVMLREQSIAAIARQISLGGFPVRNLIAVTLRIREGGVFADAVY